MKPAVTRAVSPSDTWSLEAFWQTWEDRDDGHSSPIPRDDAGGKLSLNWGEEERNRGVRFTASARSKMFGGWDDFHIYNQILIKSD